MPFMIASVKEMVDDIDTTVDELFEPLRGHPAADAIAYWASELADFSVGWHLLNASAALADPRLEGRAVRMAVTLGVESAFVNGMIKPLFKRDRPTDWEHGGERQVRRPKTASFPSGHASSATVAAILLSDMVPTLKPVWWGAAAIVATSRIHTRMHHASDVAAGAVVGLGIGVVARHWSRFSL